MQAIQLLIDNLSPGEIVLFLDEVEIHLNPKTGSSWTLAGNQNYFRTPGCNEKRCLASVLDHKTRNLTQVEGDRKNRRLFLNLLNMLATRLCQIACLIHRNLNNYGIPASQQVQLALNSAAKKPKTFLAALMSRTQSHRADRQGPTR